MKSGDFSIIDGVGPRLQVGKQSPFVNLSPKRPRCGVVQLFCVLL